MKISKEFVVREIAGEYIIVPVGNTALEFNGLFTVNELGAYIWKLLQEDRTEEELVKEVVGEYDVEEETARQDIEDFLRWLREKNIIDGED